MVAESWRRMWALAANDLRVYRQDPSPMVVLIVMPIILIAFMAPAFRLTLVAEGYGTATGAEQAVPGMLVMSSMFLISYVGVSFLREHRWCTWSRLRSSPARPLEIVLGKAIPQLLVGVSVQVVVLLAGMWLFGMNVAGSLVALLVLACGFAATLVAFGIALFTLCRSHQQMVAISNFGTFILAGMGGALGPVSVLPAWIRAVSPVSPAYWALKGFRRVILDGAGVGAIVPYLLALLAFAAFFAGVAVIMMRTDRVKHSVV